MLRSEDLTTCYLVNEKKEERGLSAQGKAIDIANSHKVTESDNYILD